ncbi:MAG: NuoI/complex I 23 kDa subunit family protein [Planctomycetota bacterium]
MRLEKRLTWRERIAIPELIKGLAFTFRLMFRKPVTRQYPEERYEAPAAVKGQPLLVQDEDGTPRCVACSLCEVVCPPKAITIQGCETERFIEREPEEFTIDMLRCILCGLCEEVCPKDAIVMSDRLELADFSRESLVFRKERLLTPVGELSERLRFTKGKFDKWKS